MHHELSEFRYCTVFVIEGSGLDSDALERELDVLGDSLLVVGDATALKVHVHTDDPGAALSIGTARGTIEGVEIADMHRQTRRARGTAHRELARRASHARDRRRRRRARGREPSAVREHGRDARDRGRADDEPVHGGHRCGGGCNARDRGDRAAEQQERDPQRRAGDRPRQQADARRADRLRSGGSRCDGRLRRRSALPPRTRRRCSAPRRASSRGR